MNVVCMLWLCQQGNPLWGAPLISLIQLCGEAVASALSQTGAARSEWRGCRSWDLHLEVKPGEVSGQMLY